jgi:hypothetical protein
MAAACYAAPEPIFVHGPHEVPINSARGMEEAGYVYDYKTVTDYHDAWPWDDECDKRWKHGRLRQLVIAGALIAAEIDRLQAETVRGARDEGQNRSWYT